MLKPKNTSEFDGILRDAGSKLVVVDFFATWCGPCKAIAPTFQELANKYTSRAVFVKVDVDEAKDITMKYQVRAMPTFIFFNKGQSVGNMKGADPNKLKSMVEELLKKYNVFVGGKGYSLGGQTPQTVNTGAEGTKSKRFNPWAQKNFVPSYAKHHQENLKPAQSTNKKPMQKNGSIDEDAELALAIAASLETQNNTTQNDVQMEQEDVGSRPLARGTPLGRKPNIVYEDDEDDDIMKNIKKKAAKDKKKLLKKVGENSKPASEMTKQEKLERLNKLKAAKKAQKKAEEERDAKAKERQRKERIKKSLKQKKIREDQEKARLVRLRKKEKQMEKLRKKKIREKIQRQNEARRKKNANE